MEKEEDISGILSEYYLQNRQVISLARKKYNTFCEIYNDLTQKKKDTDETHDKGGFFQYVNQLSKMSRNGESYCGVDMADFAIKFKSCHSFKSHFDVSVIDKDRKGQFVTKKRIAKFDGIRIPPILNNHDVVDGYELIPIENDLFSVFKAFVNKYLEFKLFPGVKRINLQEYYESIEPVYSWDNIIFRDTYILVNNAINGTLLCSYFVPHSKPSFEKLKPLFKKNFPNLEIRIRDNKTIFNDEKRFNEVLMSVNTDDSDDEIPDLVSTPKPTVLRYFDSLSNERMKEYVVNLKQKFFSYLCQKQLDKYKIKYALEKRVNMDSEADEDAFIFTINESPDRIVAVFENVLDQRSSIAFIIEPNQYDKAINSISGYFSSNELNKREFLSLNYVNFKNAGIKKVKRIIHNDFSQWVRSIDWLSYSF